MAGDENLENSENITKSEVSWCFKEALDGIEQTRHGIKKLEIVHTLRTGTAKVYDSPEDDLGTSYSDLLSDLNRARWDLVRAWVSEGSAPVDMRQALWLRENIEDCRKESQDTTVLTQRREGFPGIWPESDLNRSRL